MCYILLAYSNIYVAVKTPVVHDSLATKLANCAKASSMLQKDSLNYLR
jgi:hypothetical protein